MDISSRVVNENKLRGDAMNYKKTYLFIYYGNPINIRINKIGGLTK